MEKERKIFVSETFTTALVSFYFGLVKSQSGTRFPDATPKWRVVKKVIFFAVKRVVMQCQTPIRTQYFLFSGVAPQAELTNINCTVIRVLKLLLLHCNKNKLSR